MFKKKIPEMTLNMPYCHEQLTGETNEMILVVRIRILALHFGGIVISVFATHYIQYQF